MTTEHDEQLRLEVVAEEAENLCEEIQSCFFMINKEEFANARRMARQLVTLLETV